MLCGDLLSLCVYHIVPPSDDYRPVIDTCPVSRKDRLDLPALRQDQRARLRGCIHQFAILRFALECVNRPMGRARKCSIYFVTIGTHSYDHA